MAAADPADARIPGRGVQLLDLRARGELPGERMLASARSDHQHSHSTECKPGGGWFEDALECGKESGMHEPGLDRHEWETEWAELEPLLNDSPAEVLPAIDDFIAGMLAEVGYPIDTVDEVD